MIRGAFALAALLLAAPIAATAADSDAPIRQSFYLPMRDGVRLAVNVYRPAGGAAAARYPVVFAFTPYRARFRGADGKIEETGLSERLGLKGLTEHGYVVAVADIRGKGASFGARRGFQDRTEANDAREIIEWLAHQPWADGKVGMTGCSYLGGSTLQAATTAPPSLKAIFVGASDIDKYAFVRRGGITAQFNTRPDEPPEYDLASVPVDADSDGAMLRAAVAEHARNTPMGPLWYAMPHRDDMSKYTGTRFWEEVGPYSYFDRIKKAGIASYFWGNWQDEPTAQVIELAATLNGRLLAGPGSHCVPPPGFDFSGEVRRFFDRHLKGLDAANYDRQPRVTYWLDGPGDGHWVRTDTLPGVGVKRTSIFLGAGTLGAMAQAAGSASFKVDYNVGKGEYFAMWADPQTGKGLSFTGQPLAAAATMVGYPIVDLTVSADRKDANVFAYLEDVNADGKSTVISFGRLAASQRKLSKAPYDVFDLPWHSGRAADAIPLTPGVPAQMRFDLTPGTHVFAAGHRLRVTITGADPRQRNLKEITESPPPVLTVAFGGKTESRIELPMLPEAVVAPR